jgi:hypothetical protein
MDAHKYLEKAGDVIAKAMAGCCDNVDMSGLKELGQVCEWYNEIKEFLEHHGGDVGGEDDLHEELLGAKKYMDKWQQTGDASYQQMAKDELKHYGILAGKTQNLDAEKAKQYKLLHDQMAARLG